MEFNQLLLQILSFYGTLPTKEDWLRNSESVIVKLKDDRGQETVHHVTIEGVVQDEGHGHVDGGEQGHVQVNYT